MEHISPAQRYAQRILFRTERKSKIERYLFALVTVGMAMACTFLFENFFDNSPYLLFWAAVSLSAFYSGLGPSLMAALLSTVLVSFFFLSPTLSLYASLDDVLRLLISITIAILISSLYEAHNRTARRLIQIQGITARLSGAVTATEVKSIILDYIGGTEDVEAVAVAVRSENEFIVDMLTSQQARTQLQDNYQQAFTMGRAPISYTLHTKQPQWIEDLALWAVRFPELSPVLQNRGVASLPMIVNDRLIGAVDIIFHRQQQFDEEVRLYLTVLVHECTQAFARAQLYEAEAEARHDAEKANELKTRFLAMISHELRSPLGAIKGFASTMLASDVTFSTEEHRRFAGIIDEEADRLSDLIEQLLDLSLLQAGMFRIEPQRRRLHDALAEAIPQLETLTEEHNLTITLPDTLPLAWIDSPRIAQVLVNLVGNSVRYAPAGTSIQISGKVDRGCLRIDVGDQGPGIPVDQRHSVFEVFVRGDTALASQRGAGLGLAISRGIVEAHGGRIWVQECNEPGTTISFTLPAENK